MQKNCECNKNRNNFSIEIVNSGKVMQLIFSATGFVFIYALYELYLTSWTSSLFYSFKSMLLILFYFWQDFIAFNVLWIHMDSHSFQYKQTVERTWHAFSEGMKEECVYFFHFRTLLLTALLQVFHKLLWSFGVIGPVVTAMSHYVTEGNIMSQGVTKCHKTLLRVKEKARIVTAFLCNFTTLSLV